MDSSTKNERFSSHFFKTWEVSHPFKVFLTKMCIQLNLVFRESKTDVRVVEVRA